MSKRILSLLLLTACAAASAKLPAPDDAAKAKAAETAAKAAWQAKVDGWQLCKAQDKVAARYRKSGTPAASPKMPPAVAAATPAPASAPAATSATPAPAAPAAPAAPTPVAFVPPAPCTDPGPFAYNPPEQKPLEASGAHSPSGTASGPPSTRPEAAKIQPNAKP